ncbi:MAG TPA: hypothetical protein DEG17_09055 [Cyanobacteria bacterium UBA11149]|nr:hypothetical protein [Cyanobacteria bacterium UBA11367]HBE60752.1 hypothetical protein [Cyanobacteria bacterium UBA11366]HBK66827.1 hypothetical protein [Cyanobacteria bacterium UBA11166]HBR72817.1 hypothetical protein [Cyanobacteria bacterium UBA11159]HBS68230.1 hypothetical protein [Cyanobacteria bacterium UBA11153]HBW89002.1 hypothetical protein [Cyanobacteria bacterium UBA11149]HCA94983.1 hypothetical protein [Cyanobacteria bacterium UBA9226]
MNNFEPEEVGTNSSQLVQLFSDTMNKRQISFADWYELLAAPLDAPYSADAEDTLNRMIYGVRHGLVKVVDKY